MRRLVSSRLSTCPRRLAREGGVTLVELTVTLALFAVLLLGMVATWTKAQEAYVFGSEKAELQQNLRAAIDFMARELRAAGRDVTGCAFDYTGAATRDCTGAKIALCSLRLAGPDLPPWPAGNGLAGGGAGCSGLFAIPYRQATASTIRIRSDRNDNGRIAGTANALGAGPGADRAEEDVTYALTSGSGCPSGVSRCLTRDDGTGLVALVAVEISEFTLTYYPRPGFGPCAGLASPCPPFALPLTSQDQADSIARVRIIVRAASALPGPSVSRALVTDVVLANRR